MTNEGYKTSSKTIHKIIAENDVDIFEIEEIIKLEELQIPFGCQTIDEYETWFLNTHDCRASNKWYNRIVYGPIGSDSFYRNMFNIYGTKNAMHVEELKTKMLSTKKEKYGSVTCFGSVSYNDTILCKYGVTNISKLDSIKKIKEETCSSNYGVNNPMQSDVIKDEMKQRYFNEHGIEYAFQNEDVKNKSKKTKLEKHGDKYYTNTELAQETFLKKYGAKCPLLNKEIAEKSISTLKKNYGDEYTHTFQVPAILAKAQASSTKTHLEKYGVENSGQIKWKCAQCNKTGKAIGNLLRWHRDHDGLFLDKHGIWVKYGN